jgi:Raf kinase inhibitor-like YbhB/YbcL family protein
MSSRSQRDLSIRAVAVAGCLGVLMALGACNSANPLSTTPTPKASKIMTSTENPYAHLPKVPSFTVVSSTVADGQPLPAAQLSGVFGAGGEDISPELSWSGFPAETKSFVVTMYDPEAPTGSGFWHWVVADIPATTTSLPEDAGAPDSKTLPDGAVQLGGDAGMNRYIGGAPPAGSGVHEYYITVTALDEATSGLGANASGAFLGFNIAGHTIARASLVCPTSAS